MIFSIKEIKKIADNYIHIDTIFEWIPNTNLGSKAWLNIWEKQDLIWVCKNKHSSYKTEKCPSNIRLREKQITFMSYIKVLTKNHL